ncbi:Gfo/Idh/MocA family oxidoreductase [Yinghuangia sp. ASG 101]|uniref:Gfo/Idh/MocA family protein n=1 Tax=Yinghuangia sp. ASG 101 TaxID=2896848 RepID=UPI001E2EA202|nr:Gfo/Idh/MocA family oxidoreductase [Yinghuangia sp. ASG 101]UGQ10425.1 Gfo/Idh/MocA family oxidoreductase [Yinghuangia sp. ASG 101]
MSEQFGWGIAATGSMARTLAKVIAAEPGMRVAAVASRDKARAAEFAREFGDGTGYGSYAEMVADPAVRAVYVATPHAQHREVVDLAIAARKPVLCEKPLAASLADAEAMAADARAADVFLMEAMWMWFNPLIRRVKELADDGTLGEVRSIHGTFGFPMPFDAEHRLWNPELGGGALLDLGVYPVALAHLLLGEPESVEVAGALAPSGVDAEAALLLRWPGGAHALLETSLVTQLPLTASVIGTRGRAELDAFFHCTTRVSVHTYGGGAPQEFTIESPEVALAAEVREVRDRVLDGRVESPVMPLDATLAVLRTVETARRRLGAVGV